MSPVMATSKVIVGSVFKMLDIDKCLSVKKNILFLKPSDTLRLLYFRFYFLTLVPVWFKDNPISPVW